MNMRAEDPPFNENSTPPPSDSIILGAKVFLNHRQPSQEVAPQRVWQRQFVVARPANIGSLDFQMDLSESHVK